MYEDSSTFPYENQRLQVSAYWPGLSGMAKSTYAAIICIQAYQADITNKVFITKGLFQMESFQSWRI